MEKIWEAVKKLFVTQKSKQPEQNASTTITLQRLRDAAEDVNIVKGELLDSAEKGLPSSEAKGQFLQAHIYIAAADVLKVIADTFSDSTAWLSQPSEANVAEVARLRNARSLYDWEAAFAAEIFKLTEKARRELVNPSPRPKPIYLEGLISIDDISHQQLLLFLEATQKLEEAYRMDIELADEGQDALKDLLARLKSKTNSALSIAGDGVMDGEISSERSLSRSENRLWVVQIYDEIFSLWILIAQELVCPGVTESLKLSTEEIDPNDVWLMTDPVARTRYEREGMLAKLENDIRYEVMRGEPWQPEDIEYLEQVKLLSARKVIRKLASFWSISPHPPVYRALKDWEIRIKGKRYPFKKDQEIVWACPMTRDMANLDGPVLIEDLQSQKVKQLCGEMSNAMMGRGMKPMNHMGGH